MKLTLDAYGEKADLLSSVRWKDTPHIDLTDGVILAA